MDETSIVINELLLIRIKVDEDKRYHFLAYIFVMHALTYTVEKMPAHRHLSGPELLVGVRELGLELYGPLARQVFERWGIYSTRDVGNIVYNLIELHILGKKDDDRIEDFDNVYSFPDVFDNNYSLYVKGLKEHMKNGTSLIV